VIHQLRNTDSILQRSLINNELFQFDHLKRSLENSRDLLHLDEHGFVISPSEDGKIDLLITALTHGDEVVGIEAVNSVLQFLVKAPSPTISIGFLLCNVEAAKVEKRFLETDLNRGFMLDVPPKTREERRAQEVGAIVKRARVVLDMHQTVEPTSKPFYCISRTPESVRWAHFLEPKLDVITFPQAGFSHSGKTLIEQVTSAGGVGLVVEWGQKGYSLAQARMAANFILQSYSKISAGEKPEAGKSVETMHLCEFIRSVNEAKLIPGLENFMYVEKNQIIARTKVGEIVAPRDGYIFFPKYGELAKVSAEICEIAVKETVEV
jgi:succinylglutamate desuccinylase